MAREQGIYKAAIEEAALVHDLSGPSTAQNTESCRTQASGTCDPEHYAAAWLPQLEALDTQIPTNQY